LVLLLLESTDNDTLVALRILPSPLENDVPSLISRAIINDYDLNLARQLVGLLLLKHEVDVSAKHVWQALLFVVGGYYETEAYELNLLLRLLS
jgi:hypothetical protein